MQKVTRFLESNVEWFALGLAVLFLGWTTWTYLINDPVSRPLENSQVNPSDVDSFIDAHAAQRLRDKMDPNTPVPDFHVPDYTLTIRDKIAGQDIQTPELATTYWDYAPFDVSSIENAPRNQGPPVVQLPTPPIPQPLLVAAALDTISPPAPANGAVANTGSGKDVRLVVAAFTISWDDLYKQWNTSFGPAGLGQPARLAPAGFQITAVTAYRSELTNQTWSKPEEIQILNTDGLPPYPQAGDKVAESAYRLALAKAPKTPVAPDFPTITAGALWKDPVLYVTTPANAPNGQTPPDQNGAMGQPDLSNGRTVNTSEPLGTLYAQYMGPGGPGGRGGFPGGGPPRFAPPPPQSPEAPPVEQPTAIPPADGTVDPKVVLANPSASPTLAPVEPVTGLNNVPAMPAKSPDLCIYIIDDTAEAGKTYRYCISYKVLNPVYNKPPMRVTQKGQAWINQFDLTSKFSDFSPTITVPTQTYLFCGQAQGGRKPVFPFEVFTWTGGKWLKDVFNAGIGDPIGGLDGGIDYSTGYTFADQRTPHEKTLVTLVDNDGNVLIKDPAQDATDPNYKKAAQWVEQTKGGVQQPMVEPGAMSPYGQRGGPPSSPYYGPTGAPPSPYGPGN